MYDSVEVEMKDAHVHSNSDDDIQQYILNMVKVASIIKEKVITNVEHAQENRNSSIPSARCMA